ncbi:9304_t:CDS:2 [Cetraspora pellucida]|uniref:9304_t:CDS:1 n=1 Tax=Cetraspora pellucida TaxID=1433469 RepID=A0ACA9K6M9_9GLOM|nr:9304_t:CDS:2 [Cetraspora pellucida]
MDLKRQIFHKSKQMNDSIAFIYYFNSYDELKNKKPQTNQCDSTTEFSIMIEVALFKLILVKK